MNDLILYRPVCIRCGDEYVFFPPLEILFVQAITKFSRVYCINRKIPYITSVSITEIHEQLPPDLFCRVHRSYIVSFYHLRTMNKKRTRIFFAGDLTAHIGESYLPEFLRKLEIKKRGLVPKYG